MDEYDFDLYEKQQAQKLTAQNMRLYLPEGLERSIAQQQVTYSKRKRETEPSTDAKRVALMAKEYSRERPQAYLDSLQKEGLKWEDIIYAPRDAGEKEMPPQRLIKPPTDGKNVAMDLFEE